MGTTNNSFLSYVNNTLQPIRKNGTPIGININVPHNANPIPHKITATGSLKHIHTRIDKNNPVHLNASHKTAVRIASTNIAVIIFITLSVT